MAATDNLHGTRVVRIHPAKPPYKHKKWENGNLVFDNTVDDEKRIRIPVIYRSDSDNWFPCQKVTMLDGSVQVHDVFDMQHGERYVILLNNKRTVVIHDGKNLWHLARIWEV